MTVSVMLVLAPSAHAIVQLLPEMLLKREGPIITDATAIPDDLAVTESLLAFTRAEKALQDKGFSGDDAVLCGCFTIIMAYMCRRWSKFEARYSGIIESCLQRIFFPQ